MEFFEKAENVYRKSRTWRSWFLGIETDLFISAADLFYEAGLEYCLQGEEANGIKSMSLARHLYRHIILSSKENSENYLYALDKLKYAKI
jgi:hypothetical protein